MMTVSGLFAQNKNISLTGDFLNLLVSILLGRKLGILGILLGTSCTLIIQYALKGWVLFRRFLYVDGMRYIALVMKILCTGIVCILCAQAVCIRLTVSNLYFQVLRLRAFGFGSDYQLELIFWFFIRTGNFNMRLIL